MEGDKKQQADRPARSQPRRLLIILHGLRAGQQEVREAIQATRDSGIQVDVRVTYEDGDTGRFISTELSSGGGLHDYLSTSEGRKAGVTVVAAGGDGTITECAAALLEMGMPKHVSLAVLPLGTSNDFAATCDIPADMAKALQLAADSSCIHRIDIGMLNGKVFMNTSSLGASSELGSETSSSAKKALGPAAYITGFVGKLINYDPVKTKLRYPAQPEGMPHSSSEKGAAAHMPVETGGAGPTDGAQPDTAPGGDATVAVKPGSGSRSLSKAPGSAKGGSGQSGKGAGSASGKGSKVDVVEVTQDLLHLTACNNRQLASMLQPCPDALLDDGNLDILYLVGTTKGNAAGILSTLITSGPSGAEVGECAHLLRVPWIELEGASEFPANRDGEAVDATKKYRLEVLKRRLPFHLPDNRLLVSGVEGNTAEESDDAERSGKHWHTKPQHLLRDMLMKVTRFKRPQKSKLPTWMHPLWAAARPLATVFLGFAVGWAAAANAGCTAA